MYRAAIGLLAAGILAGCAEGETTTVIQSGSGDKTKTTTQEEGAPLVLGQSVEIETYTGPLKVTAEKSFQVEPGAVDQQIGVSEAVGVQLRIENTGDEPYKDSPSNGSTLITQDDKQIPSAFLTEGKCSSNGFASQLNLAPGDERVGCIAFEAKGGKPATFQWTTDSGFGSGTAEWGLSR